jgi:hypothetical protein
MADLKISALPSSTVPLAGTEVLPIVQSSATKQVTVANLTAGRAVSALSYTSTTDATFATSSGNVGVGIALPTTKLHVSGTSTTAEIRVQSGSTVPALSFYADSANAATRNWAIAGSFNAFGDLAFQQSNVLGGNPITAGTTRMMFSASGNLGIGTTSPSASAILDAQSTTKGVRMPNMTTTQKDAIASPAAGLMVFDTTLAKLCVYSGAAWQTVTSV